MMLSIVGCIYRQYVGVCGFLRGAGLLLAGQSRVAQLSGNDVIFFFPAAYSSVPTCTTEGPVNDGYPLGKR